MQYHFILLSQINKLSKDQKMKQQFLTLESYYGSTDPKYHVAHCIKVWETMQLPSTSGEINACPTQQLLTFMRDSTDKIE